MTRLFTLLTALLFSLPVLASSLDEPHLDIIARTAQEAERVAAATSTATTFEAIQPYEMLSAGAATVYPKSSQDPFSLSSANMPFDDVLDFKLGNGLFKKLWVSSPSSTKASDGLGPLYNARSCKRCHIRDGRGHTPSDAQDSAVSLFLRVSVPTKQHPIANRIEGFHSTAPEPTYGSQLQDFALAGHAAEYRLRVTYENVPVALAGGEIVHLRKPTYTADNLGYGPLHPEAMLSPRIAPQMIGLGLLEAIPAADILANADPEDINQDGISGRPNVVWSLEFDTPMLGRFGLKAGAPTVRQQSAAAFSGDIGISSPLFPNPWGECSDAQVKCRTAPHGDKDARGQEVDRVGLDLVTFYSRNLGVPVRRKADDEDVLRGKQAFYSTGCIACHNPSFVTHRLKNQPEQSFQLIWPYTDLLLHDMGEGLADNRPEARANGREWRTPPLWGIGLTQEISGQTNFLHDGRARSLLEAVLWHDGEAKSQRDAVVAMKPHQRMALIRFLESL